MAPAQPIQIVARSRTLRVTWILIAILAILPILWLWFIPFLHSKNFEVPTLTEPGTLEWIIVFTLGSIGCVVLVVGQILAFQNHKVPLGPRAVAAAAVVGTLLLWAYWFYATTTKSVAAAPVTHSVKADLETQYFPRRGLQHLSQHFPGHLQWPQAERHAGDRHNLR